MHHTLMDASPDPSTQVQLLAVVSKESGAGLHALPIFSIGLRMEDDIICVAVGWQLCVSPTTGNTAGLRSTT